MRLDGAPEQVHVPTEPIAPGVKPDGVSVTDTMLTSEAPVTVIMPLVSTFTVPAYFEVVVVPQLS